jgi:guanine nucleotide-binding protein G(i) subunit alpha
MGNCQAPESNENLSPEEIKQRKAEQAKTRNLDAQIDKEIEDSKLVHKLLLLGAGESGKSTLFKQMVKLYGEGFSDQQRKETYIRIVHANVISNIKTLCHHAQAHAGEPGVAENLRSLIPYFDELKSDTEVTPQIAEQISKLWADAGIQNTFQRRHLFQLNDSCFYFLNKVSEVAEEKYIPSDADIFAVRVRTTGIVSSEFLIDGNRFQMFDVGGQRNERKKWIHCFENVTAVIFVAALSEYDQVLYEDENVNRMTEALTLFDEIANSRWFKNTSIMLFLNKRDLFAEKIEKKAITVTFPEYTGPQTYEASANYIRDKFLLRNRQMDKSHPEHPKRIYSHITCATDSSNVRVVFNAVKDIVIRVSLEGAGLV